MGSVGRVPPTLKIMGSGIFGPLQLLQLAVIFRSAVWEAYSASEDLAKLKMVKERGVSKGMSEAWVEQ